MRENVKMLRFFYKTKDCFSLLCVTGPVIGFLLIDKDFVSSMFCLCAVLISLPLTWTAFRLLPFRLWLLLWSFFFCYGLFLMELWADTPFAIFSAILAGIGCGGLLFVFPANLAISWFRKGNTFLLGTVWSLSFFMAILWQRCFLIYPYQTSSVTFLLIFLPALLFLKPPAVNKGWFHNPLTQDREIAFLRPSAFITAIAASLGLAQSLTALTEQISPFLSAAEEKEVILQQAVEKPFLYAFMILSPLAASLLMEKKGAFSGCMLPIFLCEISVLFLSAFSFYPPLFILGKATSLAAASSLSVVLPILVYYLYGPANYLENYGRVIFFLPAGFIAVLPFQYLSRYETISQTQLAIPMLLLLLLGLFSIFSAWKHRFVILKNNVL